MQTLKKGSRYLEFMIWTKVSIMQSTIVLCMLYPTMQSFEVVRSTLRKARQHCSRISGWSQEIQLIIIVCLFYFSLKLWKWLNVFDKVAFTKSAYLSLFVPFVLLSVTKLVI